MATLLEFGVGAVLIGAVALLITLIRSERWRRTCGALGFAIVLFVPVMTALRDRSGLTWAAGSALAVIAAAYVLLRVDAVQRVLTQALRPHIYWSAVAGIGLAAALASVLVPIPKPSPAPVHSAEATQFERRHAMASLRPVASPIAWTDRGRRVRLHVMPDTALRSESLATWEAEMAHDWGVRLAIIRTGPPDRKADCHGWVFGDGEYWIVGADVEWILEDNDYVSVTDPQAGDLVVYRDSAGLITHTAVVVSISDRSDVFVESKWSWLGTYLHRVDSHPYGGKPTFFRSARDGHRLMMRATS